MRIVHLSYNTIELKEFDVTSWLNQIDFFVGILEHMAADDEVHAFFNPHQDAEFTRNNVHYHFTSQSKWQLQFPLQLNSWVKKLRPDVVIIHGLIFPVQVMMLHWQLDRNVKILAQHHAERPKQDFRQYLQRLCDPCIAAYFFCAPQLSRDWVDNKLVDPAKVHEVMEASSRFIPIDRKVALSATGISGDFVFLWVGRLNSGKDPLFAVKGFIEFHRNKSNAQLYMIFQTEELLGEVKLLIENNNARDYIHLVGKVDHGHIDYWYSSADFVISTSHYEGSGIAVCEAMSCGCVPIVTDIPSFRMMTDNGKAGELFEVGNPASFLDALNRVTESTSLAQRSVVLKQFTEHLSFEAIVRKMKAVIEGAVKI